MSCVMSDIDFFSQISFTKIRTDRNTQKKRTRTWRSGFIINYLLETSSPAVSFRVLCVCPTVRFIFVSMFPSVASPSSPFSSQDTVTLGLLPFTSMTVSPCESEDAALLPHSSEFQSDIISKRLQYLVHLVSPPPLPLVPPFLHL